MPEHARWLIKTALVYFAVGIGLGLVRAAQATGIVPGSQSALWLPQLHVITVGWLTQLIFGVAYWLFPRPEGSSIGSPVVWVAYLMLNTGLVIRLVCEPGILLGDARAWGLLLSSILQWVASLLFVGYFWRRVREK